MLCEFLCEEGKPKPNGYHEDNLNGEGVSVRSRSLETSDKTVQGSVLFNQFKSEFCDSKWDFLFL